MEKLVFIILLARYAFCCDNAVVLRRGKITEEYKQEVVDVHNRMRYCIATGSQDRQCDDLKAKGLQPKAANMQKMEWDDKLAEQAQKWANECTFAHNKNYDSRFCVGQNLGISYSSRRDSGDPEFGATIQRWFDEQKHYTYTKQRYNFPHVVGHYTQLVWAETSKVGCGYVYYLRDNWYTKLHVCNYGPCGNFIGKYPYITGNPSCSRHNMVSSDIRGLCTPNES